MKQKKIYIYGRHAVEEALTHAPQIVRAVSLAANMDDKKLRTIIRSSAVPVEPLDERKATSQVEGNAPHQGVIALISLSELVVPFEKFMDTFEATEDTSVVFLSEIQDPHNVGTIIRSAAAFGVKAVLMPTHNQAPVTGSVIKASAGMAFRIPLVSVENMQAALGALKKKNMKVYGLAAQSNNPIDTEPFHGPSVFVFGNEAEGIAPAAKVLCDKIVTIPMNEKAESLNVAASAAVALYAWSKLHKKALIGGTGE